MTWAPADNGILAKVSGTFIASASQQLPKAGPDQANEPMRAVIVPDVPDLGAVRITYRLDSYKHGRSRHWYWRVVHAELAQ